MQNYRALSAESVAPRRGLKGVCWLFAVLIGHSTVRKRWFHKRTGFTLEIEWSHIHQFRALRRGKRHLFLDPKLAEKAFKEKNISKKDFSNKTSENHSQANIRWKGSLCHSNLIKRGRGREKRREQKSNLRSKSRKNLRLWLLAYGIDWVGRDQKPVITRTTLYSQRDHERA